MIPDQFEDHDAQPPDSWCIRVILPGAFFYRLLWSVGLLAGLLSVLGPCLHHAPFQYGSCSLAADGSSAVLATALQICSFLLLQ